jgi:hypothetical protein
MIAQVIAGSALGPAVSQKSAYITGTVNGQYRRFRFGRLPPNKLPVKPVGNNLWLGQVGSVLRQNIRQVPKRLKPHRPVCRTPKRGGCKKGLRFLFALSALLPLKGFALKFWPTSLTQYQGLSLVNDDVCRSWFRLVRAIPLRVHALRNFA